MKLSRLMKIEEYVISNETVSLDELCEVFNISKNTVRRDIDELIKGGSIKKVYGGVTAAKNYLVSFEERNIKNKEAKATIAKAAASFVNDGDIIFIDSGTTVPNMVNYLTNKKITILTCSLNAVLNGIQAPDINIISFGGTYIRKTNSFDGIIKSSAFKDFNINKAFMAATGISLQSGVTNSSPLEYEIKKTMVDRSEKVFLLTDQSKFNISSLMTYCKLEAINCLITDKEPPEDYIRFFNERDIDYVATDKL